MFFISLSAPCQHPASLALRQQQTTGGVSVGWERPARVGGGIILTAAEHLPAWATPLIGFCHLPFFLFFTEIPPEQALEFESWFLDGPRACLPPPRTYVAQHGAHVVGPRRAEGWGHCSHVLDHVHGHLWVILVALPSTKRNGIVNSTVLTWWRQATIVDSVT